LKKFNIDVSFTKHFADRMNDDRNSPAIKVAELQKFFKKIQKNKGRNILSNLDITAVLKDMQSDLNIPVVIKNRRGNIEMVAKTIMRTKSFRVGKDQTILTYEKYSPDTHTAGDYVTGFRKSKKPQFKGKSDKKIQKMAIAAYLGAKENSKDK
tara:strand:+ start:1406 stop:1864 length:459 start_codon:yes stop_codon:yes gene_type:complete